jgi:hypothetical protein
VGIKEKKKISQNGDPTSNKGPLEWGE